MSGRIVDIRPCNYLVLYILFIVFDLRASHLPSDYQNRLLSPEPVLETLITNNEGLRKEIDNLQLYFYSGDSLFLAGRLEEAVNWYDKAAGKARILNESWALIVCYNRIGFTKYWLNQYKESKFFYAKSVSIINQEKVILDSIAWFEAILLMKITEGLTSRSESILKHNLPGNVVLNQHSISQPSRKLKYFFLKTRMASYYNDFNQMKFIQDEEKKILKNKLGASTIWLFYYQLNLAKYYMYIEDFPLARQYYNELLKLVENDPSYAAYNYFIYFGIFDLNVREHNYAKADQYSGKILAYIQGRQEVNFYSDYLLIGYNYQQLGKNDLALMNYKKAENILMHNNLIDDRLVLVYWYIAFYHDVVAKDRKKQEHYLLAAKTILAKYPDTRLDTYISDALAELYVNTESEKALAIYDPMLEDLDRLLNDDNYFQSRYPIIVNSEYLSLLNGRGRAYYYLSKANESDTVLLRKSYMEFGKYLSLVLKIFQKTAYEDSKISVLNNIRSAYENVFNIGYTLFQETGERKLLAELFNYSEDSKAYLLKNYLSEETIQKISGITEDELLIADQLSRQINSLLYTMSSDKAEIPEQNESLIIDKILEKTEEYDAYIRKLELKYPEYASMKQEKKTIVIDQLQKRLDPTQAILHYFFNFNSFYIFYIDSDTFDISYAPIERNFSDKLLAFRKNFEEYVYGDFSKVTLDRFSKQSYDLYKQIIKPFKKQIRDKSLFIIPDAELGLIPFETLCTENPDSCNITSFSDIPYLVLSNPVSYLFSVYQLLDNGNSKSIKASYSGFAPQYRIKQPTGNAEGMLNELPGTKEEVLSAKNYFRGKVYLGEQACKKNLFRACKKTSIVHLAMHALLDEEEPRRSLLLFSPDIKDDEKQLHIHEVYGQDIRSSLIVLSACNTGVGKISKGEGIFSISRSFLQAGIRNVIYTQWSVTDRSSAQLMDYFYKHLAESIPVDKAMQLAKTDFLKKGDPAKAHPYYWAGYVNMGIPIQLSKVRIIPYLIPGIFLIGIVFAVFIFIRRSKESA